MAYHDRDDERAGLKRTYRTDRERMGLQETWESFTPEERIRRRTLFIAHRNDHLRREDGGSIARDAAGNAIPEPTDADREQAIREEEVRATIPWIWVAENV